MERNQMVADNIAKSCSPSNEDGIGEEDLQKGEISDMLTRNYNGNEPLKFVKTGKQLKEIIPNTIATLKGKLAGIEAVMATLQTQIGFDPTQKNTSNLTSKVCCNMYPYDKCSPKYNESSRSYPDLTDEQKLCQQYNDLCYNWRYISEDIVSCNVVVKNLEDGNKYTLSVSQLVALCSGDEEMQKGVDEISIHMTEKVYNEALEKGILKHPMDMGQVFDDNLEKGGDRSHLQKKMTTDKNGRQRTVWVKGSADAPAEKKASKKEDGKEAKPGKSDAAAAIKQKRAELSDLYDADEDNEYSNFFEVVSEHYEPDDDGESEHTMLKNVAKSGKIDTILKELKAKIK